MQAFPADHSGADVRGSPNFGPRRDGLKPSIVLLHYTGMESGPAAEDWLCNPDSVVSSHYLIHEDGRIVQLVPESERAWHAGRSSWKGNSDVNSASIGIEIVNPGHTIDYPEFPSGQIASVIELCASVAARWPIPPECVLAHSDVAPGRKIDPGEKFPWADLHRAGIGHYVTPVPMRDDGDALSSGDKGTAVEGLQSMLSQYGYGIAISGEYDDSTRNVVEAFQRHFRPMGVDGIADVSTQETLKRLLSALDHSRI